MLDQEGLRGPTSCDWRTSNSNACEQEQSNNHKYFQQYMQKQSNGGHLWRGGGEIIG